MAGPENPVPNLRHAWSHLDFYEYWYVPAEAADLEGWKLEGTDESGKRFTDDYYLTNEPDAGGRHEVWTTASNPARGSSAVFITPDGQRLVVWPGAEPFADDSPEDSGADAEGDVGWKDERNFAADD